MDSSPRYAFSFSFDSLKTYTAVLKLEPTEDGLVGKIVGIADLTKRAQHSSGRAGKLRHIHKCTLRSGGVGVQGRDSNGTI